MIKFVENAYLSVLEKEKVEKEELETARRINEELKNKLNRLEQENGDLKEKFTKNEIDIINRKNELNNLLETLQKERRVVLEESQRLQVCKDQIDSINSFIDKLKPIKEQLNFKGSVTECLHDLLIKTKLRVVESDDLLQQLHEYLTHLEYDVEKTKDVHRRGVGHWQDEFLTARLREADVILEFDKLKREMATIKNELEEKILIRNAQEEMLARAEGTSTKSSWNKDDKEYEQLLLEEEAGIANTVELQNEIDFLRHQTKKLKGQKEDCENKIRSNEEMKIHFNEVRRSIWLREFETNKKIDTLKEQYAKLTDKMSQELKKIRDNIADKDLALARIEEKIKRLQELNDSLEHDLQNTPKEEPAAKLEEKRSNLEKEIVRLQKN